MRGCYTLALPVLSAWRWGVGVGGLARGFFGGPAARRGGVFVRWWVWGLRRGFGPAALGVLDMGVWAAGGGQGDGAGAGAGPSGRAGAVCEWPGSGGSRARPSSAAGTSRRARVMPLVVSGCRQLTLFSGFWPLGAGWSLPDSSRWLARGARWLMRPLRRPLLNALRFRGGSLRVGSRLGGGMEL